MCYVEKYDFYLSRYKRNKSYGQREKLINIEEEYIFRCLNLDNKFNNIKMDPRPYHFEYRRPRPTNPTLYEK